MVITAAPSQLPRVDTLAALRTPSRRVRSRDDRRDTSLRRAAERDRVGSTLVHPSSRRRPRWRRGQVQAAGAALARSEADGARARDAQRRGAARRTVARLQSIQLGYSPEHLSILSLVGTQSDLPAQPR